MATIDVKDAGGSTVAIEKPNANGQALMAASAPVVIASDQSAVPISGTVSVSGTIPVSGSFYQATQPVSIAAPVSVTGTFWQATQPISAAALPLPAGAATSAKQDALIAAIGTPFQAGASIANAAFGISGTLPAFAATPTFNMGALNGAATAANQTGVASTTREYSPANGYRAAVAATATTIALSGNVTLSASREVRVRATTACWLRFATAGTGQDAAVPASGSATTGGMPIEANQPEVIRIPAGCTHLSVIRESADGTITFTPVA